MQIKKLVHIISMFLIIIICTSVLISYPISACTGFTVHDDQKVIVAHNKDWWSSDTWIHVYPADNESYARLFFEIPYPHIFNRNYRVLAGGINDQGLCYESFVTPFKLASYSFFKPPLFRSPVDHILETFTTVQEVIDYLKSHNLFFLNYILCSGQIFVVDQTGDAAIIEGDDIIRINGNYQVCTNFLHSTPSLGGFPCWRYDIVFSTLQNNSDISIPLCTTLLDMTHQQGYTQYSWIYEIGSEVVYLYNNSDYDQPYLFDLETEFSMPAHSYYFPSLFQSD